MRTCREADELTATPYVLFGAKTENLKRAVYFPKKKRKIK